MGKTYRLLILDDDVELLKELSKIIVNKYHNITTICYDNYDSYLEDYKGLEYDFVIADIIFGRVNSIKVYNRISKNSTVPLVYMSGNDTRTFDVYDTPHEYFLGKPIDNERLFKAIDRLLDSNSYLTFDYFKKSYYVDYKDIMYLESDKRLIHIVCKSNIYQTYGKLDEFAERMPSNFIRISKSFLVNKKYVKEVGASAIVLVNGEQFTISRSFKKEALNAL